jgi:predicted NUDIX family phosphoesterase
LPDIDTWHGIRGYEAIPLLNIIQEHQQFHPRYLMEEDPSYKQIIPYLIFQHQGRYFTMTRKAQASEQRLQSKVSLGIGGHLNQKDLSGLDIMAWAVREFEEEVSYSGTYTVTPLGALNDDTNAVGKVHLGLVLLLQGDSEHISIKDEHAHGSLLSLEELNDQYDRMETWSQIVYSYLVAQQAR